MTDIANLPNAAAGDSLASTVASIDAAGLRRRVAAAAAGQQELAVVDVREERLYTEGFILFSANVPLSRFELLLAQRLPRRTVPVVVIDRNGELSQRAAAQLQAFGYPDVSILTGGIAQWQQQGNPVYAGFNVRSKAFAEIVEHEFGTPTLSAAELETRRRRGDGIVIFDSRQFAEYHDSTVPGAISVPGAELVRSVRDLAPDESTTIVVSCGGRTRSIVGAQSLISAGISNPVYSLRNGTGGLRLDGLPREHGAARQYQAASADALRWASAASAHLARVARTPALTPAEFARWRDDASRTLYVIDLRPQAEYETAHLQGAQNVSGGQLLQETDVHAPVWGARIVLIDDAARVRAGVTAYWLAQLGHFEVATIPHDAAYGTVETGTAPRQVIRPIRLAGAATLAPPIESISSSTLAALLAGEDQILPLLIDLSSSRAYRKAHIAGSQWLLRDELIGALRQGPVQQQVVLTSEDGVFAQIVGAALVTSEPALAQRVLLLAGGNLAWITAGLPLEPSAPHELEKPERFIDAWMPPQQVAGDVLGAVAAYLKWEIELLHQLAQDPDRQLLIRGVLGSQQHA